MRCVAGSPVLVLAKDNRVAVYRLMGCIKPPFFEACSTSRDGTTESKQDLLLTLLGWITSATITLIVYYTTTQKKEEGREYGNRSPTSSSDGRLPYSSKE
jgi:hypothetical protein